MIKKMYKHILTKLLYKANAKKYHAQLGEDILICNILR